MLRQEDDQTVWTTASEKIRKITIDGERRYKAGWKSPAPAHLDLKTGLPRRSSGDNLKPVFAQS
jgi:hypothetical protein